MRAKAPVERPRATASLGRPGSLLNCGGRTLAGERVARLERFELPTFGSVDRRSNPAELQAHRGEQYTSQRPGLEAG